MLLLESYEAHEVNKGSNVLYEEGHDIAGQPPRQ